MKTNRWLDYVKEKYKIFNMEIRTGTYLLQTESHIENRKIRIVNFVVQQVSFLTLCSSKY